MQRLKGVEQLKQHKLCQPPSYQHMCLAVGFTIATGNNIWVFRNEKVLIIPAGYPAGYG
jgi:hypothetical protein